MYHILGQRSYNVIFPKLRVPVYLMCQPNEKFKVSDAIIRGSMLTEMAKETPLLFGRDFTSMNRIETCAAPLAQSTKSTLERLGIGRVTRKKTRFEIFDALEFVLGSDLSLATIGRRPRYPNLLGSCMPILKAGDSTQLLNRNTVGDIWIRAPSQSIGYYRNAEATKESHSSDGWIFTGDVGYVDEMGNWYIVDRKRFIKTLTLYQDLIKVNCNHVAPTELEAT
ncbi:hypothetical protein N7520_009175 [Penicillium odoratum]|uniref:uncharacterized protein n=1 Tax=Penicillium odoratum TaxID=1167516 RepID=UPI0025490542|nr:uncharacterized protein N7520_009175 [Penicillium odoratum]KAJ5752258.1 hypothetical protein N7520_009175 [Penicillium odoratum]